MSSEADVFAQFLVDCPRVDVFIENELVPCSDDPSSTLNRILSFLRPRERAIEAIRLPTQTALVDASASGRDTLRDAPP